MPSIDRFGRRDVLSSDWTGLSPHLIASFWPLEHVGDRWVRPADSVEVQTPITEATLESIQNWHSQFENTGVQQSFASLSALLQTGTAASLLDLVGQKLPAGMFQDALRAGSEALSSLQGLSGVTKLNSTQVYTGTPPIKLSMTVHFRALTDPDGEVRKPMDQLLDWSMPQKLAPDGVIGTTAREGVGIVQAFPSKMPTVVAFRYGGTLWSPMVIESVSTPITVPRTKDGEPLHASITMTLGSLTAWDRTDYQAARYR